MKTQEKGKLIGIIIAHLRAVANAKKKHFSDGDLFLSLCFKTDKELLKIAKLSGIT